MDATPSQSAMDSHLQSGQTQLCIDTFGDGPADDFTGIQIQDRSKINEAGPDSDVGNIGNPHLIDRIDLPLFEKIPINRQVVIGIGGLGEPSPGNGPEIKLLHDPPDTFGIDPDTGSVQRPLDAAIAIAGKLAMNAFDLLTQLLILVTKSLGMFQVGLVVIATGGQPAYLTGFRN